MKCVGMARKYYIISKEKWLFHDSIVCWFPLLLVIHSNIHIGFLDAVIPYLYYKCWALLLKHHMLTAIWKPFIPAEVWILYLLWSCSTLFDIVRRYPRAWLDCSHIISKEAHLGVHVVRSKTVWKKYPSVILINWRYVSEERILRVINYVQVLYTNID